MRNIPNLCIIVACYNDEEVIRLTAHEFLLKLRYLEEKGKIGKNSRILFVNDGSTDNTWEIIKQLSSENKKYYGISQNRNRGQQKTIFAGLMETKDKYDITISIDSDGQDDINIIDEMLEHYMAGNEIVYGVRKTRNKDNFFKKNSAELFYKFSKLMGTEAIYNHADYRLVSCKAIKELEKYNETNIFLRGLFPLIGFKSVKVYYNRNNRIEGKSSYTLSKLLTLASDGIIGFSTRPLHFIFFMGVFTFLCSFIFVFYNIFMYIFGKTVDNLMIGVSIVVLLGGIQLISIGIIGEYIGKICEEVRKRPLYIIDERTE